MSSWDPKRSRGLVESWVKRPTEARELLNKYPAACHSYYPKPGVAVSFITPLAGFWGFLGCIGHVIVCVGGVKFLTRVEPELLRGRHKETLALSKFGTRPLECPRNSLSLLC